MQRYNPFNQISFLFPFRWYIIITLVVGSWMAFTDLTGRKMFNFSNQQQWAATGPGNHK
jgi:hypothetical protein